jgi:hypothetical protein
LRLWRKTLMRRVWGNEGQKALWVSF